MTGHGPAVNGSLGFAYVLSSIAAALLAVISVSGLFFGQRGLYDPDPATLPAFYAQDAVSLLLAIPLLVVSMLMTRRGSVRGLLLWSGALSYIAYWYYFYIVGARFNPLFLAYIALVSVSLFALAGLLTRIDSGAIHNAVDSRAPARAIGGFLTATAVLFAAMWCTDIIRRLLGERPLDLVARYVYVIDLTALLPLMAVVGTWVWRRRPWGYVLAGLLLVKAASSGIMLLAGTAMQMRWGVAVDPAEVSGYAMVAIGGLLVTALYFRTMDHSPSLARTAIEGGVR